MRISRGNRDLGNVLEILERFSLLLKGYENRKGKRGLGLSDSRVSDVITRFLGLNPNRPITRQ